MAFYPKEKLEIIANNINKEYYPERLEKIVPFDTYDFIEKQGLEIEWKYITPNKKILGMVFFGDEVWPVWDSGTYKHGDKPHKEFFKKGTVVINNILIDEKNIEKERFVSGHEAMHWVKDRDYFQNHTTDVIQACKEEAFEKTYWNSQMYDEDIIERQTNYLNAAVLMPKEIIKKEFFRRLRRKTIPLLPMKEEKYMIYVLKDLAKDFGLNLSPVRYRLYDLNILERNKEVFNI